uniref:Neuropeptide-Like Protein n=1 Tax=Strongyloides stercoralis TaxID=6248 RepID=A0A0K0DZJ5_STRER
MNTFINILYIFSIILISLHMKMTVNGNEIDDLEEMKRIPVMGFAKRYPYKSFAFAKRGYGSRFAFAKRGSDEVTENNDDSIDNTINDPESKRSYPYRFAFAKRAYNSRFAFAKKSYPRSFAFA